MSNPENYNEMGTGGVDFGEGSLSPGVGRSFGIVSVNVDSQGIHFSPTLSLSDPTGNFNE